MGPTVGQPQARPQACLHLALTRCMQRGLLQRVASTRETGALRRYGLLRLKHIDCRQNWVKTLRDRSILTPVHVDTKDNLADIFTKILDVTTFTRLRDRMMMKHV